jgi:hypothetical protein
VVAPAGATAPLNAWFTCAAAQRRRRRALTALRRRRLLRPPDAVAATPLPVRLPSPRCGLALLLLAGACAPALAVDIRLQPSPLRGGEPAFVVLDTRNGCRFPLPSALSPQRRGDALEVRIEASDACSTTLPPQTLPLPLGRLPADIDVVRAYRCIGNVPPGLDPCSLVVQAAVLPGSSTPAAQPVPLSAMTSAAGALLILLLGSARLPTRQRG